MARLKILTIPNDEKKLRTKSDEFDVSKIKNHKSKKFFKELEETMYVEDGAGLAAPQVDKMVRVICVNFGNRAQIFINPNVTQKSWSKCTIEEGCLSVPGVFGDVKRPKAIEVEYFDIEGNKKKGKYNKTPARILQHEIDHLNGILFIDKIK